MHTFEYYKIKSYTSMKSREIEVKVEKNEPVWTICRRSKKLHLWESLSSEMRSRIEQKSFRNVRLGPVELLKQEKPGRDVRLNGGVFNGYWSSFKFLHWILRKRPSRASVRAPVIKSRSVSGVVGRKRNAGSHWLFLAFACVRICDLRLVDWANFLLQPSNGQT